MDAGGNRDGSAGDGDSGDGDASGDGDGGSGDGDGGGPGPDAGSLTGHPKSCDAPILAGIPGTTESEDVPELITGPEGKALITWSAPSRVWHARSYDGENLGTIHQNLFPTNYVTDEGGYGARAVIGYGHALFIASVVNGTNYARLWDEASDRWDDPVAQVGETITLGVRPNGRFLRVLASGSTASLETIDPETGDVETQPLSTISQSIAFQPRKLIVNGQDQGVFTTATSMAVHAYLLRVGEVVASGTLPAGDTVYTVDSVLLADGTAAIFWNTNAGISVAYVADADEDGELEWSDPVFVMEGSAGAIGVVGTPDGELTVTWGSGSTYARRYVDGAWGDIETLRNTVGGNRVAIAISDAGTVALMVDPNTSQNTVLHTVLKGELAWSSLEVSGLSPYRARLAFNAKGEPYFIWASGAAGGGGRREIALTTCR